MPGYCLYRFPDITMKLMALALTATLIVGSSEDENWVPPPINWPGFIIPWHDLSIPAIPWPNMSISLPDEAMLMNMTNNTLEFSHCYVCMGAPDCFDPFNSTEVKVWLCPLKACSKIKGRPLSAALKLATVHFNLRFSVIL